MTKTFFLSLVILLSASVSYAQCKEINKSLKLMNNKDIDSSISLINTAEVLIQENGLESVDERCLAKYYYIKGAGFLIKGQREDSLLSKIEWFEKSAVNYRKFIQLEEKPSEFEEMVHSNINSLGVEFMNIGILYYENKDYVYAHNYVEMGLDLKRSIKPVDISEQEQFNALVCAKLAKNYTSALIYCDSLLAKEKLSIERENKYLTQKAELLVAMEQKDAALVIIKQLEERNPRDVNPKLSRLQIYLDNQQNDSALAILAQITALEKSREDLWILKAQLAYQKGLYDEAKDDFTKAIQLNPENTTALYGLAVAHVNTANVLLKSKGQAAKEAETDEQQLERYKEEAKNNFTMAAAYLNKMILLDENNLDALTALKDIYHALGDTKNRNIIEQRLKDLKQ